MFLSYNKDKISKGEGGFTLGVPDLWNGSHELSGLDWNYLIAPYIDRDLHEKLLAVTLKDMQPLINEITGILTLIRSGYFYTATLILTQLDVSYSEKLSEIKVWLLKTLKEADDTEDN